MCISRAFDRIESKIFLIIVLTTLASSVVVFGITYRMSYMLMVEDVRTRTTNVNSYAQATIPLESFLNLATPVDEVKVEYTGSQALLDQIRQIANVRYLFTSRLNADGKIIYLIDGLPKDSPDFRHVGDLVEDEILPDLNLCFAGKKVNGDRILNTSWGAILLTCWPKFDQNGQVVGAIVMEYDAEALYQRNFDIMLYSVATALVISALFIGLASLSLRKVSVGFYKRLAYTDVLTGLYSRTAFERALDSMAGRERGVVLVACDLNQLKYVNDQYGHAAGDAYLRRMGEVLRSLPFDDARHYRVGGDEFASVIRGASREVVQESFGVLLQQIRDVTPTEAFFDFSFGVVDFDPAMDKTLRETLPRADSIMYAFKRKNSVKMVCTEPVREDDSEDLLS